MSSSWASAIDERLRAADAELAAAAARAPLPRRQPVHTLYVPADRYHADFVPAAGEEALRLLQTAGSKLGYPRELIERVEAKLRREPIEDLRVDFEDGYGIRADQEEDDSVRAVVAAYDESLRDGTAPASFGVRFKGLAPHCRARGLRTLDLLFGELAARGIRPADFVVTLPKVTSVDQVDAMAELCELLEARHGLARGAIRFEIQVETPQCIVSPDGLVVVAPMIGAARGRCTGLHYGTYDYATGLGIPAALHSLEHPAADHAKDLIQVAAAGTGVQVSDGSTNVLPVGDRDQVLAALTLHARLVRRAWERGLTQGWDLHAGQLVTRYLATFAFLREGTPAAVARLHSYLARENTGILEEPATASAFAAFLLRALACGAIDEDEAPEAILLQALERREAVPA